MGQTEGSEPSPLCPPAGSRPSPAGVGPGGHRAAAAAAGGGGGPGHVPHKTPLAPLGPACPHCFPRPPCAAAWPWLGASALPASAGEQLGAAPRTDGAGLHPAASSSSPLFAPPRGNQDFPTRVCTKLDFPFPRCTATALFPSLLLLLFPSPRAGQSSHPFSAAEDAGVAAQPLAPALPRLQPRLRRAPGGPSQVPDPLRCLQVPEPQLPQRLRPRPLQLLPHLRRGRGGLVWPQGGSPLRGQPGLPLPHGQALRQGGLPVQAQRPGVWQRRPHLRQRLPAEGGEPQGAAARSARCRPGPEGSL